MTTAELLTTIRAEIERLKESLPREVGRGAGTITPKGYGMLTAYNELLSFLDTLEEPVCEDELYKEIERWINSPEEWDNNIQDIEATARHFANWQKEQMENQARKQLSKTDITLADMVAFDEGMKLGRRLERQDMMKEAVEGEVVKDISNKLAVTAKINLDGFKFGDKVKLIVVPIKED